MTRLAIIPARAGSKRILNKNIKSFHGKPIIAWSIEAILKSKLFDKVVVSTNSEEIAKVSIDFGAEILFKRPKNISGDHTGIIEVVRHGIKTLEKQNLKYKVIALVYATAPFLNIEDISNAVELISDSDFCVSVSKYDYPIQRALFISEDTKNIQMIDETQFERRSQDLRPSYHDAGQFVVGTYGAWNSKVPFVNSITKPIIIPNSRVQDIDTIEDWELAEQKFSMVRKSK